MNQKWHKRVRRAQIKRSKTAAKTEKGRPKIYTDEVLKKTKPIRQTNYKLQILIGVNWIGQLNERREGEEALTFSLLSNTLMEDEAQAVNQGKTCSSLTEPWNVRAKGSLDQPSNTITC